MPTDEETLRELNVRIAEAETAGRAAYLADAIAPRLAFRRANGVCVNREEFLSAVAASAKRETTIEDVQMFGKDRAVVSCVVTMTDASGVKKFHNLRLFVRDSFGQWKLLGWANEGMP